MDLSDYQIQNFSSLKVKGELLEVNKLQATIFETEYSGILTGNLGKSYTYQEPVFDVMKPI